MFKFLAYVRILVCIRHRAGFSSCKTQAEQNLAGQFELQSSEKAAILPLCTFVSTVFSSVFSTSCQLGKNKCAGERLLLAGPHRGTCSLCTSYIHRLLGEAGNDIALFLERDGSECGMNKLQSPVYFSDR